MTHGIYAIWDNKAKDIVADVLTIHRHRGTAVRLFTDALRGKGDLAQHPTDYDLIRVGNWNDGPEGGQFVGIPREVIYTGLEFTEAIQQGTPDHRPALSFPGIPTSDR